jgi:ABC-type multidrug transport system, ATPase and permease components
MSEAVLGQCNSTQVVVFLLARKLLLRWWGVYPPIFNEEDFMFKHKYIKNFISTKNTIEFLWNASKKNFTLLLICNILSGLAVPCGLLVWKEFINSLINLKTDKLDMVIIWLCFHGLLQIITDVLYSCCTYLKDMQSDYVNKYITARVLNQVDEMEMEQFDDTIVYNKMSKINNEALSRSISVSENVILLVRNLVVLFGVIGILYSYNKVLVFAVLLAYLPVFCVNNKIYDRLHNIYNARIEKLRLIEVLKEIYTKYENIKEIRLYGIEEFLKNKVTSILDRYIKQNKSVRKQNLCQSSLARSIQYIATYVMKLYVIIDTLRKGNTVGDITMYINSIDILQEYAGSILNTLSTIYNDNLYIQTLFEFLSKNELDVSEQKISIDHIETLEFIDVSFKYPGCDKMVLRNINMRIQAGKSYLIVGFNGSGKTTLIKLLIGIYKPTSGTILVNGQDIKKYDVQQYRKLISAVFQDFLKLPLSVNENIQIGNIGAIMDEKDIKKASKKADADEFICKLPNGYNTILQRGWKDSVDLSGGQWQKIALSRAYFSNAALIVMDEPAAALDAAAEDVLYRKILEMINKKTCIMISHRLTTAQVVDWIYVMDNGNLVESGDFAQLINSHGAFQKLYNLQAEKYMVKEKGEDYNARNSIK